MLFFRNSRYRNLLLAVAGLALVAGAYFVLTSGTDQGEPGPIGGTRDEHGCLGAAGYTFDDQVGACARGWELTQDIRDAARRAVERVGPGYALTVVSFNSYEEPGAYDIMFESGEERAQKTVTIRGDTIRTLSCYAGERYLVVERDRDDVGSDFLIKRVEDGGRPPCIYDKVEGDVELTALEATYFLALQGQHLILDSGTAPPPRGLAVYDIELGREVYTDRYNRPLDIDDGAITYWQPYGTQADLNAQNCPEYAAWKSQGLGGGLERRVSLDLSTLQATQVGESRCSARQ